MFVCLSEQIASQPTKRERKPENCEDVLQDLPCGKAQPDVLKVARNKSCWGLCWVSIVPLAPSAPRQEVTLTVCRFTTILLKSKLQRKREMRIKDKSIEKHSNVKRQNLTHYWILPPSHSSDAHKNGWVRPSGFNWMLPYIHFWETTYIKIWMYFCDHLACNN